MKKFLMLISMLFLLTSCELFKDNLDGAKIYTTIYPIQFLVDKLYGNHATIQSIYPTGADINDYVLTKKQIKNYANSNLFIYNGLSNEKNITKNLINQNHNLLIIDVSNGLNYKYSIEELWLSPNNFLMLAKNIKDNLNEYLTSEIIKNDVNKNYEDLAETLSIMDADLRSIAKDASKNGNDTLIVNDDVFNYLQDYGFKVISLDSKKSNKTIQYNAKTLFKNQKKKNIIVLNNNIDEELAPIIHDNNVKIINVSDLIQNTNDDYIVHMQAFIDELRNISINN